MRPAWLSTLHGIIKAMAIVVGLALSVVGLMSVIGLLTANGWARAVVAVIFAIAVPAVVVDRLLPKEDPLRAPGLASDVFASVLLSFGVAFVAFPRVSRGPLLVEADREAAAGAVPVARLTYLMAGATPIAATTTTTESSAPSTTPAGSPASTDAGLAPPVDAGKEARGAPVDRTPAELFRELAPAVVTITEKGPGGEGGGTGFVLDSEGTVATNHHVIKDAVEVRIKLFTGTWVEIDSIELLADNPADDLALLRIHTKERLKAVDLGDSEAVTVGEHVISIGNPLGLEHTLTDGLISSRRLYEGHPYIQMSAPVSPGNSGGPLFNMRGEVIGVTTGQINVMFGGAQNLNLAIPINVIKSMILADYPHRHAFGKGAGTTSW